MNPIDVIESYVIDVMRRVPAKDRNEVGLELRGLLTEMLDDRALAAGRAADDAMVLAMLREFGTPAAIAARYRPPGMLVIPAEQTRSFATLSIIGIALQWALTLPLVFDGSLDFGGWWLTWGLGAFWWPGFQAMIALLTSWLRARGLFLPKWTPRVADPDRIDRSGALAGLAGFAIGMGFMIALPWLVALMPAPIARVLEFDPDFLRHRAWPVVVLWLGAFALAVAVARHGRRNVLARRLEIGTSLCFVALLAWWISAGDMFVQQATNDGARGGLALVIAFILIDLAVKLYRGRPSLTAPNTSQR